MSIEPWVNCRDIDVSMRFYTEVLDFVVHKRVDLQSSLHDSQHAIVQRGGGLLHLDAHAGENGVFGVSVYVRVEEELNALFDKFVSSGLSSVKQGPIDQSWGMREFWLTDPDGNVITFGENLK